MGSGQAASAVYSRGRRNFAIFATISTSESAGADASSRKKHHLALVRRFCQITIPRAPICYSGSRLVWYAGWQPSEFFRLKFNIATGLSAAITLLLRQQQRICGAPQRRSEPGGILAPRTGSLGTLTGPHMSPKARRPRLFRNRPSGSGSATM